MYNSYMDMSAQLIPFPLSAYVSAKFILAHGHDTSKSQHLTCDNHRDLFSYDYEQTDLLALKADYNQSDYINSFDTNSLEHSCSSVNCHNVF
ncbi:hypothetical protein CF106_16955 [Aeromonas veronii]|nr:hypothetical protein CF106_16955 [Aeromonas veronii]